MQVYNQEDELIEDWQWNDPALRNLSDVVVSLLHGKNGRLLDLGCGTGRLAAELASVGFSVDGIDIEEHVITIGKKIMSRRGLKVNLYAGSVFDTELPIATGNYDVIICTEVLEHVKEWRPLLVRGGKLLKPGGILIVSVPRDAKQFSVLDTYAGHFRRFREQELLAEIQEGYEDITIRRLGWPSMRSLVWIYTSLVATGDQSHARQSQALWRKPGLLKRCALIVFYVLLKFDNLFSFLPFGTTLVIRAIKKRYSDEQKD